MSGARGWSFPADLTADQGPPERAAEVPCRTTPADVVAMGATAPLPTRDIYDLIPKVELHCHVEGTLRPGTVAELASKAGRPLPGDDPSQLYRYRSLDDYLSVFWL